MALRTSRDTGATAVILGRTEDDIRRALSTDAEATDATVREQPAAATGEQKRRPAKRPASDYRFGGDFWVVLDTEGQEVRKVRTGVTDLDRVEIVTGLDKSDRVLILPSSHLVETQQDLQDFINRRVGRIPGIN